MNYAEISALFSILERIAVALETIAKQTERSERTNDKIIESLESMAEDMRAMGAAEKASGVDSALWLIEEMNKKADAPQTDCGWGEPK